MRIEVLVQYWHERPEMREQAVTIFKEAIKEAPKAFPVRAELVRIYLEKGESKQAFALLCETFRELNWTFSDSFWARFPVEDLAVLLEAMGEYLEYRARNGSAPDFFETFGIDVETAQKIEFAFGVKYARLAGMVDPEQEEGDLLGQVNSYGTEFLSVHELCSELIVENRAPESAEELTEVTTELVVALPAIVLKELSRQIGWTFTRCGLIGGVIDRQINNATYMDDWFTASVEPVLKGVHNAAPWTENDYREGLGLKK